MEVKSEWGGGCAMPVAKNNISQSQTTYVDCKYQPQVVIVFCLFVAEAARDPARLKEAIEADRYWERYLASNSTVMAHTFQVEGWFSFPKTFIQYNSVAFYMK